MKELISSFWSASRQPSTEQLLLRHQSLLTALATPGLAIPGLATPATGLAALSPPPGTPGTPGLPGMTSPQTGVSAAANLACLVSSQTFKVFSNPFLKKMLSAHQILLGILQTP